MEEINITFKILAGFICEIFFFFYSGALFMEGYTLSSLFFVFLGLIFAWRTAENIQKQAIKKYKK